MFDSNKLLKEIEDVVKALGDPECEYMKGYRDALLAIKGIIKGGEC